MGALDYDKYSSFFNDENEKHFLKWMRYQRKETGLFYRGYTFNKMYFEDCNFEVGKIIGIDELTQDIYLPALTRSKMRAALYTRGYGEICFDSSEKVVFEIEAVGKHIVDISKYSHYPKESECRCTPLFKCKIAEIKKMGGYLKIKAIEI